MESLFISLFHGLCMASIIGGMVVCMERQCPDEVQKLLLRKGGKELYQKALNANFVNLMMIGPVSYHLIVEYLCLPGPFSPLEQLQKIAGVVLIQGFFYYLVHKAFHQVKGLWWIHSFHHHFNEVILPSSADAVSVAEFSIAYMAPLAIGCAIVQADRASAVLASGVIGFTNVWIHTPFLEGTKLPWFLVSTSDHTRHHRSVTTDYAAPVIHFDRIFAALRK